MFGYHAMFRCWVKFDAIVAHLRKEGRPLQAICGMELRSPEPFSFTGFNEFNAGYVDVLKRWDLLVDGINPVARTLTLRQRLIRRRTRTLRLLIHGSVQRKTEDICGCGRRRVARRLA